MEHLPVVAKLDGATDLLEPRDQLVEVERLRPGLALRGDALGEAAAGIVRHENIDMAVSGCSL